MSRGRSKSLSDQSKTSHINTIVSNSKSNSEERSKSKSERHDKLKLQY